MEIEQPKENTWPLLQDFEKGGGHRKGALFSQEELPCLKGSHMPGWSFKHMQLWKQQRFFVTLKRYSISNLTFTLGDFEIKHISSPPLISSLQFEFVFTVDSWYGNSLGSGFIGKI